MSNNVTQALPLTAYMDLSTTESTPVIKASAQYGLLDDVDVVVGPSGVVSTDNSETIMLYHSLSKDGGLAAGRALVTLTENNTCTTEMQLNWQWLTGDLSSGISKWSEVNA